MMSMIIKLLLLFLFLFVSIPKNVGLLKEKKKETKNHTGIDFIYIQGVPIYSFLTRFTYVCDILESDGFYLVF